MATVHTDLGDGEIVASESTRGRTHYKVALRGGDAIWMDETEVNLRTGGADVVASNPRDRAHDTWASGRDRGVAEHGQQDLQDDYDPDGGWLPDAEGDHKFWNERHEGAKGFDFEPTGHTFDNDADLPYNPYDGQFPVDAFRQDSTQSPDHEIDRKERLRPTKSHSGEPAGKRPYPGPNPDLFAKQGAHVPPHEGWDEQELDEDGWPLEQPASSKEMARGPGADGTYRQHRGGRGGEPAVTNYTRDHPARDRYEAEEGDDLGRFDEASDPGHDIHPGYDVHPSHFGNLRPAGLSDKFIQVASYADHYNDPVQRFRDDPLGTILRVGSFDLDAGLDHETGQWMDTIVADGIKGQIFTSAWRDVASKAKRLRREGAVDVQDISHDRIYAKVAGDHGIYDTMIAKGGDYGQVGQGISNWRCSCDWGKWAFKRQFTFVGRLCSHAYAAYQEMQSRHIKGDEHHPFNKRRRQLKGAKDDDPQEGGSLADFKSWIKSENSDHLDMDAADRYVATRDDPMDKAEAAKIYEYALGNVSERPERDYDQDGYTLDNEEHYKTADLLRHEPHKMSPDMVVVPRSEGEDAHYFTDLGDDRKTTGPDQIMAANGTKGPLKAHPRLTNDGLMSDEDMLHQIGSEMHDPHGAWVGAGEHEAQRAAAWYRDAKDEGHHPDFAWHDDKADDFPESGIVHFSARRASLVYLAEEDILNKMRDLSAEDPEENFGRMREHNEEVSELADELHDRGMDAGPIVAMTRRAMWRQAAPDSSDGNPTQQDAVSAYEGKPQGDVPAPGGAGSDPTAPGYHPPGTPNPQAGNGPGPFGGGPAPEAPGAAATSGQADVSNATKGDLTTPGVTDQSKAPAVTIPGPPAAANDPQAGTPQHTPNDPQAGTPMGKPPGGGDTGVGGAGAQGGGWSGAGGGGYKVQQGDSLSSIAQGHPGSNVADIEKANASPMASGTNIGQNADLIHPGDVLKGVGGGSAGGGGAWSGGGPSAGAGGWGMSSAGGPKAVAAPASGGIGEGVGATPGSGAGSVGGAPAPKIPSSISNIPNTGAGHGIAAARFAERYFQADDGLDTSDDDKKRTQMPTAPSPAGAGADYKPTTPSGGGPTLGTPGTPGGKAPALPIGDNGVSNSTMKGNGPTGNWVQGPNGPVDTSGHGGDQATAQQSASGGGGQDSGPAGPLKNSPLGGGGSGGGGMGNVMNEIAPIAGGIASGIGGMVPGLSGIMNAVGPAISGIGHMFGSTDAERFAMRYFQADGSFLGEGGQEQADYPFAGSGPNRQPYSTSSEDYIDEHEKGNRDETWVTDNTGDVTTYTKDRPRQRPKQSARQDMELSASAREFWADAYNPGEQGYFNPSNRPYQEDDSDQYAPENHDPGGHGEEEGEDAGPSANDAAGLGDLAKELPMVAKASVNHFAMDDDPALMTEAQILASKGRPDDGSDIVRQFQASQAAADLKSGASGPGGGGAYSDDAIAANARKFLQRTAGRNYTPAEQRELEDEQPTRSAGARNLRDLDLQGTHYL